MAAHDNERVLTLNADYDVITFRRSDNAGPDIQIRRPANTDETFIIDFYAPEAPIEPDVGPAVQLIVQPEVQPVAQPVAEPVIQQEVVPCPHCINNGQPVAVYEPGLWICPYCAALYDPTVEEEAAVIEEDGMYEGDVDEDEDEEEEEDEEDEAEEEDHPQEAVLIEEDPDSGVSLDYEPCYCGSFWCGRCGSWRDM